MTTKIAIVGPESSGKSTLADQLATFYEAMVVKEFARGFLDNLGRTYTRADLDTIAEGQVTLEEEVLYSKPNMLICDTNLVVVKVWSLYKYQKCSTTIKDLMKSRDYDLHLLVYPDLPWTPDDQRENPHDREVLFKMYEQELIDLDYLYHVIRGQGEHRLQAAKQAIAQLGIE